jgi:type II secretory pathway component PulF
MSAVPFQYKAVDKFGKQRTGTIDGASETEVFRKLAAGGLTVLSVSKASARAGLLAPRGAKKVKTKDLAHFTQQLGVLVSARIPLSDGLLSIADQEKPGRLRDMITDIARRIESGEQVARAMEPYRKDLGDIYIETVRAAEKTGNLTKILEHLADMLERAMETRRQVKGALMYPIVAISVLALATLFLVGFIVPRFAKMFSDRNVPLPDVTYVVMTLGNSLQSYWYLYIAGAVGAFFGIRRAWRTPGGRHAIDRLAHKVPVVKSILRGMAISRFCRVFGLTLSSGLTLIDALDLAGKASGRPMLVRDVEIMSAQVRQGGRLTDVLENCAYLTPFAKRMLNAGEQSGELTAMCRVVSTHYDRETSHQTKDISVVIEPVLIVAVAAVVLVIALAIFLPMWNMVKLVG